MAYRFFADSSVEANVNRILNEQLERAIGRLSDNFHDTPERAVHSARKHLKKGRSVLRLVRKSIDKATYTTEKNRLRDQARRLASTRESEAYQQTIDDLLDTYGLTLDTHGLADLRQSLVSLHQANLKALRDGDTPVTAIIGELKDSRARLSHLELEKAGWPAVAKNLRRIYRQGQARYQIAYEEGSDEAFHEWRKRVKDLWHDTHLLRQLWPPVMNAFETQVHKLAKTLGDSNDIAALRHFLLNPPEEIAVDNSHMQVLLPLMKHRQHRLHRQAKVLGQKLYGEDPAAFTRRMASYWEPWFLNSSSGELH